LRNYKRHLCNGLKIELEIRKDASHSAVDHSLYCLNIIVDTFCWAGLRMRARTTPHADTIPAHGCFYLAASATTL
jgi:hypothetical protein